MKTIAVLSLLLLCSCATIKKPYFYEAKKDDRVIHLFGTMHVGVPGWDLPSPITNELKKSHRAYFEVNLAKIHETFDFHLADGEKPLSQRLTPKEFAVLKARLPKADLERLRPFTVMALAQAYANQRTPVVYLPSYEVRSLDRENGIDKTLFQLAVKSGVPIDALDEPKRDLCREDLDREAVAALKKFVVTEHFENNVHQLKAMADMYREGNDEAIKASVSQMENKCLIGERNKAWMEVLDLEVKTGDRIFVAAGVGHLLADVSGPSLLQLLEQAGYQVRRIE